MRNTFFRSVFMIGAVSIMLSGCTLFQRTRVQQQPTPVNTNQNGDDQAMMEQQAKDAATPYTLSVQNNSGQTGTVKIYEIDGKAKVSLAVTGGTAGVAQPAHIHEGTCAKIGPVVFGLMNVVDGSSETELDVPMAVIFNGSARAVNVHKSQAEVGTYVACVDLKSDDAMMEDNTSANVNANVNANENVNTNLNVNTNVNVSAGVKVFNLTARNFTFSQNEIRVKKGDTVKIVLSVADGFHDWVVDEFNAATKQIGAGTVTEVQFVANKTGTFEFYCSVGQHRAMGMKGKIIVE